MKNKENKIACLGPAGSYSHEALIKYDKKAEPVFFASIWQVIDAVVDGKIEKAIIPFENSIHGTVMDALDGIYYKNLKINDEVVLSINHSVASLGKINSKLVKFVYSHTQALNQCLKFLKRNYPKSHLVPAESTSSAAEKISKEKIENAVAVCSKFAAHNYKLKVLAENIQDERDNKTLFAIISKKPDTFPLPFIILVIDPKSDRSGLLYDILGIFRKDNINLLNIESRPSREDLGKYIFYIKAGISSQNKKFNNIMKELKRFGKITLITA